MVSLQRLAAALACAPFAVAGCGSEPSESGDDPPRLIVTESTSSQAYEVMTAEEALFWEWSAGVPLTPAEGEVLSRSAPGELTWTTDLVAPEPASLEGSSFSGVAFLLRFSSASDPTILHVFTSGLAYTPPQDAWELLAAASQPLTLVIDSAQFQANELVEDRGPFTGTAVHFTIE